MARPLRQEFAGAVYHVMARGNRRQPIFLDDLDHRKFLATLDEVCTRSGWRVHAFVLMGNHYHLVLETPQPNLCIGMGWLQNTYTRRFNSRHRAWGRLFGDRYKAAALADGQSAAHFHTLVDYVHLNPARVRGQATTEALPPWQDFAWSSLRIAYQQAPSLRPAWCEVQRTLEAHQLSDTAAGRASYLALLERRAQVEMAMRTGATLPEAEQATHPAPPPEWAQPPHQPGRSGKAAAAAPHPGDAAALLAAELLAAGLAQSALAQLRARAPEKVRLARRLRARTLVSNGWLAEHLHMRSANNVSQLLRRARQSETTHQ